jgi:hypothetical protein
MAPQAYKATNAMVTNQSRGKAYKKKGKVTRSTTDAYSMVAMSFHNDLTLEDVKKVYGFLLNQEDKIDKRNIEVGGGPTLQYLDWLENGGNAGLAWSRQILKSQDILKSFKSEITDTELNTPDYDIWCNVQVTKSASEDELKQGTFLVLSPDEVDLHLDTYNEAEVRKACHNFNQYCMKANLLHLVETDSFSIVESYIIPSDIILGDTFIKKGSWIAVLQFLTDDLWDEVKKGNFTGVSIGARARTERLDT